MWKRMKCVELMSRTAISICVDIRINSKWIARRFATRSVYEWNQFDVRDMRIINQKKKLQRKKEMNESCWFLWNNFNLIIFKVICSPTFEWALSAPCYMTCQWSSYIIYDLRAPKKTCEKYIKPILNQAEELFSIIPRLRWKWVKFHLQMAIPYQLVNLTKPIHLALLNRLKDSSSI